VCCYVELDQTGKVANSVEVGANGLHFVLRQAQKGMLFQGTVKNYSALPRLELHERRAAIRDVFQLAKRQQR
jgi:hypothetical protein